MKNMNGISDIFNTFTELVKSELGIKGLDYRKLYEENFRYLFYKSLLLNDYKNDEVSYEANFCNSNTIDKVDIKFLNSFLELKYNRTLENGNTRPFPYTLGKVIADIFKLKKAVIKSDKYFMYIFDSRFENYINNNDHKYLFNSYNKISGNKFNSYPNTFIKQLPKDYNNHIIEFELVNEKKFIIGDGNVLNIILYKILN